MNTHCLFFGDSITFGEHDEIFGGYVDSLKRYCFDQYKNHSKNEVSCFNLGIGGETTFGLIKRFEIETNARLSTDNNVFFFFYGANDLVVKDGTELVSISQFEDNLMTVIAQAKQYSDQIYILSIVPISEKNDGVIMASGKVRTSERINLFNETLLKISQKNEVQFINLYPKFINQKEEFLSRDGVHPNHKGYDFIANTIKPILNSFF